MLFGQLEDKADSASGPRMAVWQFEEWRPGSVSFQLRGDQDTAAERERAAAAADRRRHGAVRLRSRAARRPELPHRRHHTGQVQDQRRVVLRRMQRPQRTIPH